MFRLCIAVCLFAGFVQVGACDVAAQALTAPGSIGVKEAAARAILGKDSIQLHLPLNAPAAPGLRAIAWLLSPLDMASGETSVDLLPGSREAILTLPWPRDAHGKPVEQIGWYRIGYRVGASGARGANGILSVGAIAPNLLDLRVVGPANLLNGAPLSVRIYAGNPIAMKPFHGVHLEARLAIDLDTTGKEKAKQRVILREAITDASGEAILTFPFPTEPGQTATLTVKGILIGSAGPDSSAARATASISKDFTAGDKTVIHADIDKPLHKPGETVHLRALVFNDTGHAAANTALTLTIKDPDNKKLLEAPLTTNRYGIVFYDWKTGPQLAPGDYDASFDIDDSSQYDGSESTTVRIQRYELPEFAVLGSMDHSFYLEGQTPTVHIHAGYLFGKPVAAGSVRIVRASDGGWDEKTASYKESDKAEQTGTLDANGDADLHLEVKSDFAELNHSDYERYKDVEYRAIVTDATSGRSEPRNFTVRLSKEPVHIYLNEVGGNDREGDYILRTSYADGKPAAAKVSLDWIDAGSPSGSAGAVTTSRYGLARVHLRYPSLEQGKDELSLRITAQDAEGRTSKLDDSINPGTRERIWISVAHTILKPDQPIEATIHGPAGAIVDVDVLSESGLLVHRQVRMEHPAEPLVLPPGPGFHGMVNLGAYAINSEPPEYLYQWDGDAGYKSVLYPEDRELKLKLTGLQPSYPPGATVDAGLTVKDATGSAKASALGVSVIDTAVELRAETEEEANDHWFGSMWWRDLAGVSGVTSDSLNRLDMSQPVPADLDLAAEAMLDRPRYGIEIEAASSDSARSDYERLMNRALDPLGKAVLNARPAQLPATLDALQAIARNAKLDDSLLIDPWNTPYKVSRSINDEDEEVQVVSAGPDKRFGTADDFTINVTSRNLFELPGQRMVKLLTDAVAAGHTLPGTVDGLKQLTRAGSLDLDSIHDRAGNLYKYEIRLHRRFYSIQVSRQDKAFQWDSPSIDYFEDTELRMASAIRDWVAAGHPFPDSEAEARQAFTAAQIDFDALRDPLGKPFQLTSKQVMTYTQVEKVKAASGLEMTSKPVTHLLRTIQVLRTPDRTSDQDASREPEMVAQFMHPITEQSGSDAKAQAVDQGTFKGNTGAIGGSVTDQAGALIPFAIVEVKTASDVFVSSTSTGQEGTYLIPDLLPGLYTVIVHAKGFATSEFREVHVSAVSLTTVDVELRVSSDVNSVTVVSGRDAEVATDNAEISATLNNELVDSATLTGRDAAELIKMKPGVTFSGKKIVTGPNGTATISEPTFTPRLRHTFDETAYWAPSIETDARGRTSLHFPLPDSLTTWKLHALASTTDGRIGVIDQSFQTFQPFFVDLDAPQVLTVGDEITLPVNLRNYTDHALALPVIAKPAGWFSLLTSPSVQATVPAGGTTPVIFGFRAAKDVEAGPLRITAANSREGDAVEKTVRVHPDGEPRAVTASGLLRGGSSTLALDLPAEAIPGSIHAELRLYPNLGTHILHSMKAVLERPYGCGEQTISSTYPSLLFLELIKATGSTSPVEVQAQTYLQLGYDRLLGYFDPNGGLTYWGDNDHDPDPALSAYGIEFLSEAKPFINVDEDRILTAVKWLVSSQNGDGSWKPHYGNTTADLNLYVAAALKRTLDQDDFRKVAPKDVRDRAAAAVSRATAWAASSVAAVHDPYANALGVSLSGDDATRVHLRAELAKTALHDRDGAHWASTGYSPFYGWGHTGDLETTAQALAALESTGPNANQDHALIDDALHYLLRSQDHYGIWYSGQATVRVLQALLPLAIEELKAPAGSEDFQLAIDGVPLSQGDAQALHADHRLLDAPRSLDLTSLLKPGHNELVFSNASTSALASADASVSFYVPWPANANPGQAKTQTGTDFGLDFGYRCAAADALVGQPIECSVDVRRFGSNSYGMLLAEAGLPPGADVDRASLAKLLDTWTVSRYELQPDRIVFYIWSWKAEGTHFSFRFTPRYAVRAKAAPGTLSDYYNPDFRAVLAPQSFSVIDPNRK